MSTERSKWWSRVWRAWIIVGVVYELVTIGIGSRSKPLTKVIRKRFIHRPELSALMGAFLFWLPYHWLVDAYSGLGWWDLIVVAVGAVFGIITLGHRLKKLEERHE